MKLEVLLATMYLNKKDLDKMNITCPCIVINQCDEENNYTYKNFNIYSFNERGSARSRNRALSFASSDIVLFCDDDVIYNKGFDKKIIKEFKDNPDADMIILNVKNTYRNKRINTKRKRVRFYNSLNYAYYNIAVKRDKIDGIKLNELFGAGSIYKGGDDTLFIVDCLKRKLKIYTSPIEIARVESDDSTWFRGFDENYYFYKGAIYTAINKHIRHLLFLQHLIRHHKEYKDIGFIKAYKSMIEGSKDYFKRIMK